MKAIRSAAELRVLPPDTSALNRSVSTEAIKADLKELRRQVAVAETSWRRTTRSSSR